MTADRDEHIRVSRYPQSWVIEGFCLGHTAFVSRILVPGWAPQEMLSGGGDGWLGRWRWADGKCLQRIEIAGVLEGVVGRKVVGGREGGGSSMEGEEWREGGDKDKEEVVRPAVVGIWEVLERRIIIVAFERYTNLSLLPSFLSFEEQGGHQPAPRTNSKKKTFFAFPVSLAHLVYPLPSPAPSYPIPHHLRQPLPRTPVLYHTSDPLHMLTSRTPPNKQNPGPPSLHFHHCIRSSLNPPHHNPTTWKPPRPSR